MVTYSIYPAIGVARVGNSGIDIGTGTDADGVISPDEFFLAPDAIGGLPKDYDPGNDTSTAFSGFRDNAGHIRRQAQKFRVYRDGEELTLSHEDVNSITWTVHLANKKSEWYNFSEQKGNLLYGTANSYKNQGVELRNGKLKIARRTFIIDPGPRNISGANQEVAISRDNIPSGYPGNFPPETVEYGYPINTLGDLKTDSEGRLLVLGAFGRSGGDTSLDSYGGGDTWFDDISDGSVTCTIDTVSGGVVEVTGKAWVIVGPPDFAPELVNIASWDDTIFDVGVRKRGLLGIYNENSYPDPLDPSLNGFDKTFPVNYQRDILPIIKRIAGYQWVANVQSMAAFFSDFNDLDPENISPDGTVLGKRQEFFDYFQKPIPQEEKTGNTPPAGGYPSAQYDLFEDPGSPTIPKMPLNSGSNSVSNYNIKKFMALTRTQYFFLRQWANGVCTADDNPYAAVDTRNRASVGNVVGLPQCPGIEVTWTTQNEVIYDDNDVYRIKHRDGYDYSAHGLTPTRDECDPNGPNYGSGGCEPGDLTKRMAIPWQADFFNCTIQHVNFDNPNENKHQEASGMVPTPPTYYAYWWPPQAPWDVLVGDHTAAAQAAAGDLSAGLQVNYMRGINSYSQMVNGGWSYLGFIRNQNANASGYYPYFVETERDNTMFQVVDVGVGNATQSEAIAQGIANQTITTIDQVEALLEARADDNETTMKVFSLVDVSVQKEVKASKLKALNLELVEDLFKEIKIADSHRRRHPRSGSRVRF